VFHETGCSSYTQQNYEATSHYRWNISLWKHIEQMEDIFLFRNIFHKEKGMLEDIKMMEYWRFSCGSNRPFWCNLIWAS
jgi:hypothetical protein